MATIAQLQDALQNADAAGDHESATALANEIVRQRMPWTAPTQGPIPQGPLSHLPDVGQAGVIAAGRTANQVSDGMKQLMLSGSVAGRQAFGMENRPQLDQLNALDQEQQRNAPIYGALKKQFPVSTGVGEAIPAIGIPMGGPAMAGRIAAPALGMGLLGASQYGSAPERAVRGGVDALGGLLGGTVSEIASRVVQPVRVAAATATQNAAKQAAQQIGAPLLPSQQTGSPDLARIEDALARYPGSAGVMQDFLNKQRQAVNLTAGKAIGVNEAPTQAVRDTAKADMGAQYDSFRNQIPNGMPVTQNVLDAVAKARTALSQGSTQAQGKGSALSVLEELNNKLYGSKNLTPEEYSAWVSDLSAQARAAQNPQASAQLKGVGSAMDREARGPIAPEWQKLDQAYAALKTLNTPGVTNPVTGDVSPVKVANLLERKSTGARATPLADIAEYARAVPMLRAGSPTAEREAVSLPGAMNALWRYPLAKVLTSDAMREYLSRGLLASPEASRRGAAIAGRTMLPLAAMPPIGLLSPLIPAYQ